MRIKLFCWIVIASVSAQACASAYHEVHAPAIDAAREAQVREDAARFVERYHRCEEADREAMYENFSSDMQSAFNPGLLKLACDNRFGDAPTLEQPRVLAIPGDYAEYQAILTYEPDIRALLRIFFDAEGQMGFFFWPMPIYNDPPTDPVEHVFRLPFEVGETWYVFWGGRDIRDNYHVVASDQIYALDLMIVRNGKSYAGEDRTDLQSYYAFGRPILAPVSGTVVSMENELPDQAIGEMDGSNPLGNHVMLELESGAHLLMAHLQQGSVTVALGDVVDAGQLLGTCGNSGNTSEPHLHIHLQDGSEPLKGNGLPMAFGPMLVNGNDVDQAELLRGQFISAEGAPE